MRKQFYIQCLFNEYGHLKKHNAFKRLNMVDKVIPTHGLEPIGHCFLKVVCGSYDDPLKFPLSVPLRPLWSLDSDFLPEPFLNFKRFSSSLPL